MNLTSPSQVKDWCISNGFHPNKVLGQNFLIDKNALDSILDAALIAPSVPSSSLPVQQTEDSPCHSVSKSSVFCAAGDSLPSAANSPLPSANCQLPIKTLEIGPGLGVLTEGLLERGCAVTAIEKDPVLADRLKESLGNPERLAVLKGDALDYIKDGTCDGFPLMVSNLPYQAGTRILIEIIDRIGRFEAPETIVVLVQTEVAERLAASEGSKVRGLAGVRVQFDYDVQIVRKVAASCFWPRPEIGSSVVRLVRHHRNDNAGEDVRKTFKWLTKRAFEHRRKQLGSTFKGLIESTARAEELSNDDWLALSGAIGPMGKVDAT